MEALAHVSGASGLSSPGKPLAGIRVIEIGHSIAAPYAGMILGELGADVIKVENPHSGDYARSWGPPFSANGTASAFEAVNRAKRGVAIDLADPRDKPGCAAWSGKAATCSSTT